MFHDSPISHLRYGKEMKRFYAAAGVWSFGQGLVQIFIPIFLFVSGFSLGQILFFSLIAQVVRAINIPLSILACKKYGAKHVLSISFLFPILFFVSLSFAEFSQTFLYLAALFFGLKMAYLFVPYHLHLSKIAPNNKRGRILAHTAVIAAFCLAVAPVVGGFMLGDAGILPTTIFASFFFVIAALILITSKEATSYHSFKLSRLPFKEVRKDAFASGFYNISSQLGSVVWFIFVFVILGSYPKVGIIAGVSLAIGVSAVYFLGRMEDKLDKKKIFLGVSIAFALFAILRVFLTSFSGIIIGNILYALAGVGAAISWTSIFHTNLNRYPKAEYLFWMELVGALFSALIMGVFILVYYLLGLWATLITGIVVSGVSMLFVNFARLKK